MRVPSSRPYLRYLVSLDITILFLLVHSVRTQRDGAEWVKSGWVRSGGEHVHLTYMGSRPNNNFDV